MALVIAAMRVSLLGPCLCQTLLLLPLRTAAAVWSRPDELALRQCSQLLLPLDFERFMEEFFERRPMLLRRASDFYGALFSLDDVDALLVRAFGTQGAGASPLLLGHGDRWRLVKAAAGGAAGPRNASLTLAHVHAAFAQGFSLVVNGLQTHVPSVARLASLLSACTGFRVSANLYLSPAHGSALAAHMDWMDALVLQLGGTKTWTVLPEPLVALPRPDLVRAPLLAEGLAGGETVALSQGDLLYLPRGTVHRARNLDAAPSLHLTLGVEAATHCTPQTLLHHAVRLAWPASEPLGLAADGPLRLWASGPDLLHLALHCLGALPDMPFAALRAALPPSPRSPIAVARTALARLDLGAALASAAAHELLELELVLGYASAVLQPIQSIERSPIAYVRRFFSRDRVRVSLDGPEAALLWDGALARLGLFNGSALAERIGALSWTAASLLVSERLLGARVSGDAWTAFAADADSHRLAAYV